MNDYKSSSRPEKHFFSSNSPISSVISGVANHQSPIHHTLLVTTFTTSAGDEVTVLGTQKHAVRATSSLVAT